MLHRRHEDVGSRTGYVRRDVGDAAHHPHGFLQELVVIVAGRLQPQRSLEVVVQLLVGVGFGCTGESVLNFVYFVNGWSWPIVLKNDMRFCNEYE